MKIFARELLWFFIALVLSLPIAVFFGYIVGVKPNQEYALNEEIFEMELLIVGGIFGFICTYFMRAIIWAATTFLVDK